MSARAERPMGTACRFVAPERYAAAEPGEVGILELIRPAEPTRLARWRAALAWYGCVELPAHASQPAAPGARSWGDGVPGTVLALDAEAAIPARVLASRTGRPWSAVEADTPAVRATLADRVAELGGATVLVGGSRHFDAATLAALNARDELEWSVLTARDAAGLSFVVAKALAARARGAQAHRPLGGHAILDAIGRRVRDVSASGALGRLRELTSEDVGALVEGAWESAVLCAHGEGTHAQLHWSVLCAVGDDVERLTDGRPAAGCHRAAGGVVCKRVHAPEIEVCPFSDLKVAQLALFSCNGFSACAEGYPSDLSAILALADGYAASVLVNDRPGAADQATLDIAAARIARDGHLQGLWRAENGFEARMAGSRPWVRFGDLPGGAARAPGAAAQPQLTQLPLEPGTAVVSVEPSARVRGLRPDRDSVHVLLEPSAERPVPGVRVEDRTDAFEQLEAEAVRCRRRALQAAELACAARRLVGGQLAADDPRAVALARLDELRTQIAVLGAQALDALERAGRAGLLDRESGILIELIDLLTGEWDRTFAELAASCLLAGSTERLHVHGRLRSSIGTGGPCRRCRQPLEVERLADPTGALAGATVVRCTVCGPQASWSDDGPRMRIVAPERMTKGTEVPIRVQLAEQRGSRSSGGGSLLLSCKDKGTGKVFFTYADCHRGDRAVTVSVPAPVTLTSDLHTLRALWVRSLGVAYCRVRCAAVPGEPALS